MLSIQNGERFLNYKLMVKLLVICIIMRSCSAWIWLNSKEDRKLLDIEAISLKELESYLIKPLSTMA